jgi:A118 family predicted phage portal protein
VPVPLPDKSIAWPPEEYAPALAQFADFDAWWSGNPDKLGRVYQRRDTLAPKTRPSQLRGGVVGTLSRWFWGAPVQPGQRRTAVHMPLPADIATASADLLFARPPSFKFKNKETTTAWETLDDQMRLTSRLHEAAEVASPFGGVFLRTTFDKELWDHPILSAVHADSAFPVFRWGRLVAVVFVRELGDDGTKVTRYLERYELLGAKGARSAWVFHGVYVGTRDKLGRRVDLGAFEDTRGLADAIDLEMPVLPVAYAPNMYPSRDDRGSELGRSDFEGCTGLFDNLDETASSLMRDVRLGKSRAFVPEGFLQSMGRGAGATWDPDNELYASLDIPLTSDAAGITVQQFAIRVQEHVETMHTWARAAVHTAGYSASTFGLEREGGGDTTATEVNDRKSRSARTYEKKSGYWGEALREVAAAALWTAKVQFRLDVDPSDLPKIEWPPFAEPDPLRDAQTLQALRAAGAISRFLAVKAQHDDWDDKQIEDEVKRIEDEDKALTNPDTFTGGPFTPPSNGSEQDTDEDAETDDEEPEGEA